MSQIQLAQPSAAAATEDVSAPVDLVALARWMDENGLESGPVHAVSRIGGGTQNILLRFRRGAREFIFRHPPAHPRPESNKTMIRESRVLAALASTGVPHPRLIATCTDETVLGAVFYLMEPVAGFNATVAMPGQAKESPELRHAMGFALIDGLVALANVDHEAVGLSDFGRLDGFLERQVGRWAAELESYHRYPEWSGRGELGDVHGIGAWLEQNRPVGMRPGIMHGDYHIGNVLYHADGSLAAIVDWEMATLGDPLMDLGRLLSTWPDGDGPPVLSMRVDPSTGFPTREALIARYAKKSARDLSNLPWFEILACYKLGILLEGTYARAQAGKADPATGARLHATAIALLERARQRITSNREKVQQ
ncbi:aminoglycoside phosphotransferase (plasmid) [Cupriavidus necator N-1]|uniref:Aminoglycoside phosphotransferase n=1 Tax=Cupriavidus necator (strain ATCC 43291 / DSM 13513 / CCUG 52238 / LMG 8453 / N-1) TaxID=1042878 RepID=F8GWW3_CUPNN|nr:phosphotransferase family protein [Cupriavidus necator]AEI81833.1 aminoglycoside phosphotransferase [Cupriavidus necator N-1]MDX6008161.1 phosphotransferase family protein [Cupriavidus necator]